MTLPHATYRLQLRGGMDFAAARAIVPYLAGLGISHLYLSPIFTAEPGSTHGYDVTDCNEIDPALGGRAGFAALCASLRDHDMGMLLDIVPNHMAASLSNGWWADVLARGKTSPFADHFDIDWAQPVTLPVLGGHFDDVLAAGDLTLEPSGQGDGWQLVYFDQRLPLARESWALAASGPGNDPALIRQVHERQHWRLMFWKDARNHLSYRRFFEVTGLVGMRVEDLAVFEATHRLIFELVDAKLVDGLRVDHIDGLSRPTDYLKRLRRRIGPDTYLVVEKIVEGDECLPPEWPVAGTTGYEFMAAMAAALVDRRGVERLGRDMAALTGRPFEPDDEMRAAKRQMVTVNFAGEVDRLTAIAASHLSMDEADLSEAIRELLIAFPVYRSYAECAQVSRTDAALWDSVRRSAACHCDEVTANAVSALVTQGQAREFQTRFQQLSGPIMAKAVEDTLFYRDHRMLALNEVGGSPADGQSASLDRAHTRLAALAQTQAAGMRATATHDTKRGEDARARLYALSEMADEFGAGVKVWSRLAGGDMEAERSWMIFQALAGIWPARLPDAAELDAMSARFAAYLEKAMREEKRRTSWTDPDTAYEQSTLAYAAALFDPKHTELHAAFTDFVRRLHLPGWMNSLAQTAIKLTLPGVPDIYQGTEGFDDSLVDPDNRRPVAFDDLARDRAAGPLTWQTWRAPQGKHALIRSLLALRKEMGAAGPSGYRPLRAGGDAAGHCLAFATHWGSRTLVVAVPRLTAGLFGDDGAIPAETWGNAALAIGPEQAMRNVLTDQRVPAREEVALAELFARGPLAVLVPD